MGDHFDDEDDRFDAILVGHLCTQNVALCIPRCVSFCSTPTDSDVIRNCACVEQVDERQYIRTSPQNRNF